MTHTLLFSFMILSSSLTGQLDSLSQPMLAMADTYQKPYSLGGIYYENGTSTPFTGILYGRYDNGKLLTMQEYKNGIGNGKWINYDPDGNKEIEGTYVDNRVEGPVTLFYENGAVKAKGQFRHWKKPIGKWTYYDRSGKVVHTMIYTR